MSLHPRDLTYGMNTASDDEAQRALDQPTPDEAEGTALLMRQMRCRDHGDLNGLAHWSRLRWRWVKEHGRAEVS